MSYGGSFLHEKQVYKIPDDSLFLMGDNRPYSSDSREIGPVSFNSLIGYFDPAKQSRCNDLNKLPI